MSERRRKTDRQRQRQRKKETDRDRDRERQRGTEGQRQIWTETKRDRDRQRQRKKGTDRLCDQRSFTSAFQVWKREVIVHLLEMTERALRQKDLPETNSKYKGPHDTYSNGLSARYSSVGSWSSTERLSHDCSSTYMNLGKPETALE